MTERELRRTALIIPPRGRAVLCCWAAIPGLMVAHLGLWQSLPAGVVYCRRRAVTGRFRLRTPLLRLAGVSVVVITAPGTRLILPAVPAEQAAALTHALAEEIR